MYDIRGFFNSSLGILTTASSCRFPARSADSPLEQPPSPSLGTLTAASSCRLSARHFGRWVAGISCGLLASRRRYLPKTAGMTTGGCGKTIESLPLDLPAPPRVDCFVPFAGRAQSPGRWPEGLYSASSAFHLECELLFGPQHEERMSTS